LDEAQHVHQSVTASINGGLKVSFDQIWSMASGVTRTFRYPEPSVLIG
jgi:hypothetical protein